MSTRIQAIDRHVATNGVHLHYREWGNSAAPPVLILHGLTGHAWEFDGVASALAEQFRVLVVNQRGHGASAWAREYSPAVMAEDIATFIDALELHRIRIVGHSMGGVNASWLAARHPKKVEQLVIVDIDPQVITSEEMVGTMVSWLKAYAQAKYADPEEAVTDYLAGYTGSQQQALRAFVLNNLKANADGRWRWRFDAAGLVRWIEQAAADKKAHWAGLRRLACPTLVIRAAESPFTTGPAMERMVREIPVARLVEIPGAGHDIHLDQPQLFVREVRKHYAT